MTRRGEASEWIAKQQGKHFCQCGCGGVIVIQIHHHTRGIPSFINGHTSRVNNPMKGRFGKLNPNYKRGWYVNPDGYIMMLNPNGSKPKYIFQHRYVMEQHLGRRLQRGEEIHHKNRDKADNRIENLEVMVSSDHTSLHAKAGHCGVVALQKMGWRNTRRGIKCPD